MTVKKLGISTIHCDGAEKTTQFFFFFLRKRREQQQKISRKKADIIHYILVGFGHIFRPFYHF